MSVRTSLGKAGYLVIGSVLTAMLLIAANVGADSIQQGQEPANPSQSPAAPARLVHYQARLLNPRTGEPWPDGEYTMRFGLYADPDGVSLFWEEEQDITVTDGVFSALLGSARPFDTDIFRGQSLWLGVTVKGDPEAEPRQMIAYTPYALHALNADTLDGEHASAFASASHTHSTLPTAYAFINSNGSKASGTANVTSTWSTTDGGRYEITISGVSYLYNQYVTVVTLASGCNPTYTPRVGSVSGMLLVYVMTPTGTKAQCNFQFVTF